MKELFGQRLREQRIKHGLTLEQLAEKSELSSNYIGMVERGLKEPGLATIVKLLNALNISADTLLCDLVPSASHVTDDGMPQWSDEEELRSEMEEIGGRVRFCHFWIDHDSMVQLTEDCNGRFHVAYVLDRNTSPEMRREAALLAQKELADCMQEWDISLLNALVPERIKYASLAEAASHLMQVLNEPERIIG